MNISTTIHQTRRHTPTAGTRSLLAACGLAAALTLLPGCDRRTATGKAVSSSSTKLQTVLSPSVSSEGAKTHASTQYTSIVSDVKDAGEQGLPGETSAAKLLSAESQLGLTEQPFSDAVRFERDFDNRITVLHSVVASWLAENSNAAAAGLYDPTATIADAQAKAKEFDGKIASAQKSRDALAGRIKELQTQAKGKFDQAQAEEAKVVALREQSTTVNATQGARLIEQAAEIRKAADKIRTESSLLEAQADQLQPQFREAELLMAQFTSQARTYRDLIADMTRRSDEKKQDVAKARAAAAAAAQEIDAQVKEITQVRNEKLAPAYDKAISTYQEAAKMAADAGREDKAFWAVSLTTGNIKQGQGDVHWSQAQGLMRYEQLLRRLGEIKPALPNAADYTKGADEAKQAAAEALGNAKDAYEAAANAYRGAKVTGEAKERFQLLGSKLDAISQITAGQGLDALASLAKGTYKPAEESPEAAAPADEGAAPAPSEAVEAADPKAEIAAMLDELLTAVRAADEPAIAAHVQGSNPQLQSLMVAQLKGIGVLLKVDAASLEKFQARFSEKLAAMMQSMGQPASFDAAQLATLSTLKGADFTATVNGDTANVALPGIKEPLELKKLDIAWKIIAPDSAGAVPPQQLELMGKMTALSNDALLACADEIAAGKYATIDEAVAAFNSQLMQKMLPLIQQMQQQGGPGGGGG